MAEEKKPLSTREFVTADGSSGFPAEKGRYHLYVGYGCPFAHRTIIYRSLKGLEDAISMTVLDWHMGEKGWAFCEESKDKPGCSPDPIHNYTHLRQVYELNDKNFPGRVTAPVLFDKKTDRIVNNESPEIIRMMNSAWNEFAATPEEAKLDLYPEPLRKKIDELNDWVGNEVIAGTAKVGFAADQKAYDVAIDALYKGLDKVEALLATNRYLAGDTFTEADIRLFCPMIRFDVSYVGHWKINLRRIQDYPNINGWLKEIYQMPKIKKTCNFQHMKGFAYSRNNPSGIVPKGPPTDYLDTPHGRDKIGKL